MEYALGTISSGQSKRRKKQKYDVGYKIDTIFPRKGNDELMTNNDATSIIQINRMRPTEFRLKYLPGQFGLKHSCSFF